MKNNKLYTVNKWNKNLFDGGGFAGAGAGGSWDTETLQNVEGKDFNEAWDNAVKAGLKEFIFQGRRYNTKKENNPVREYNNRWVGASRRADVKNPSKAYDIQAGPIGGPLSLVPLVTDTYIGSPNRPPQLEYNPEAYDVYHHLNGMTTMSEKPRRITPGKSKNKNGNVFAYAGQMDNWISLANADKSNNPWNYADDIDVTKQYMNSTGNNWFGLSKKDNPFSKGNMAGGIGAMAKTPIGKGVSAAVGEIGYNLLSDGYRLDGVAGGIMDAAHAIKTGNPMIDTIKDTALGAVNHAIGIKTDQEALNAANSAIDYYSNYKGNAKSFDDIGPLQAMGNFKNPYKNGWVTSAADKKNAALKRRFEEGKAFAENSQINNIYNIANDQIADDLGNITAFGGPLSSYDSNMGAIEYGLLLDERNRRAKKDQNNNDSIGSLFSMPSKEYALGGDVQMNGADFTTGLTSVNAGGSHEENPYDGVQMGVDPEGTPNLVEEGEVIYNDYVYSNRIELDEEAKSKFKFPKKRDITYADAAKKLEKEVSERPNDPISQAAFKAQMESLAEEQERQKQEMEAQKAQEAFEALSPEEQVELMQYAQQQEQAEQEAAMQEQAMMQQYSPEEIAMAEQQQMAPQEIMAYGGNLYPDGGAMDYLKSKYPQMGVDSLKKMAAILEKRATEMLTDIRTHKLTRNPIRKDYDRAFSEYNSVNSNRRFNNWVNAGLSRDVAFAISFDKPPKSWGQRELDKWNAKKAELTKEPERRTVYKNPLNGKTFNTKAEADADVKAYKEAQRQQVANSKTSEPTYQSFTDNRGWKHSTQQAADTANKRYAQQAAQAAVAQQEAQRTEEAEKVVANSAVGGNRDSAASNTGRRTAAPAASRTAQSVAQAPASNVEGMNVGTYRGEGNQWDVYGKPGLVHYVSNALADYDLADTLEAKQEIAQRIVDQLNGIQQSYYDYIVPTLGQQKQNKNTKVGEHQRKYQDLTNNAGFIGVDPITGQKMDLTDQAVIMPEGHNTTDNLANGWVDEVSGPKTWLRHLGASGDNLADMVKELRARGIDYSPYADWTIGEGNSARQLYRASLINPAEVDGSMPEDAYNFGDYDPEYEEDVDTFVPVDENGNPIEEPQKDDYEIVPDLKDEWPRYAGVFGPAIGLGMQLAGIGRPDTSGLEAAANKASGPIAFAKWMPRGDFAVYKPDDPWFYTSPIMAQSNATQRSIANKSAVTKGAETLANNYATMIALGNAQRQQADNNYNKYMKAKEYNGNIYESNARRFDANSQFNAEAFNRNKQYAAQLNMQAAQAKMAADADWYNGIYGNVAGIFKGIGDIGRENAQHNMIARMAADGIFGTLDDQHIGHGYLKRVPKTGIAAKGGKLNKKRGGK